eukprot:GILI01065920.1.p1 GENE.GILI01065920.1~~GILI01065920.1.p1  ORF type:complete len:163 (-),score=46.64 GILI01065920.1:50-538(-)
MAKEQEVVKLARAASMSSKAGNPYRLSQYGGGAAADAGAPERPLLAAADDENKLERLQADIDFNEAIIDERNRDIEQIESTIGEVNEIFKDLANIVAEQGEMLNQMDSNIESAVQNTGGAAKALRIANDYHSSAMKKQICLGITCVIVLAIVITAIYYGAKH